METTETQWARELRTARRKAELKKRVPAHGRVESLEATIAHEKQKFLLALQEHRLTDAHIFFDHLIELRISLAEAHLDRDREQLGIVTTGSREAIMEDLTRDCGALGGVLLSASSAL